jgi:hypothetical protein
MTVLMKSYRSVGLLMQLNWDRILYVVTISLSLLAGLYIGSYFAAL